MINIYRNLIKFLDSGLEISYFKGSSNYTGGTELYINRALVISEVDDESTMLFVFFLTENYFLITTSRKKFNTIRLGYKIEVKKILQDEGKVELYVSDESNSSETIFVAYNLVKLKHSFFLKDNEIFPYIDTIDNQLEYNLFSFLRKGVLHSRKIEKNIKVKVLSETDIYPKLKCKLIFLDKDIKGYFEKENKLKYSIIIGSLEYPVSIVNGFFDFSIPMMELDIGTFSVKLQCSKNGAIVFSKGIHKNTQIKNKKLNYSPFYSIINNKILSYIRHTGYGSLIVTKRQLQEVESEFKFRVIESRLIQTLIKYSAAIVRRIKRSSTVILFEKESNQSEEGLLEITHEINSKTSTNAYFIHATPSELNSNHVIKKFSLKYYFVIYLADGIISSEAPMHCNILQSSNKILKDNICHKKFVFLQHGITYLKSQTRASSYAKGKEAHPNVIITSSDKESRVIQRMLGIPKERITKTGMAIFDDLSYGHLLNKPQENILVMFTWRPYELDVEPELTTLFKIISQVTSILSKVPHSCNVRVCLHPKIRKLFDENICGFNIYDGKISEVLSWANLVITDYSSICYNSFYQGAGVLFYQPDLIEFENHVGKLIPDLDEYIGHRVDNYDDLNDLITDSFNTDGFIDIKKFRNEGFERRYESINEFNDSLAKSRILNDLINRKVI